MSKNGPTGSFARRAAFLTHCSLDHIRRMRRLGLTNCTLGKRNAATLPHPAQVVTVRRDFGYAHLLLLALALLEQLLIHLRDLLDYILHQSERAQAFFYLFLWLAGDGDLTHLATAETHGENPNRSVAFPFALLAKPAAGLITTHHTAE